MAVTLGPLSSSSISISAFTDSELAGYQLEAQEAMAAGSVLHVGLSGDAQKAVAVTSASRYHVRGIAPAAIAGGDTFLPLLSGDLDVLFTEPPNPLRAGDLVYLSDTGEGQASFVPPSNPDTVVVVLGTLLHSDGVSACGVVRFSPYTVSVS